MSALADGPRLPSWVQSCIDDAKLQVATTRQHGAELTARQRYALDPFALLGGHVRILDEHGEATIFVPYDHQLGTLAGWIDIDHLARTGRLQFSDELIEKSRQMGETWILAYGCLWAITFHSVRGLVQHLRQAKVDDGGERNTTESFFGKVRYLWRNTSWDAAGLSRPRLRFGPFGGGRDAMIRNDDRPDAFIVGSGQSDDPGRGGRYDFYIGDEHAHIERTEKVHEAVSFGCPSGKVYNSTPNGQSNVFYRIRRDRPAGWTIKRYHWSAHPVYGAGAHLAAIQGSPRTGDPSCVQCAATLAGLAWPQGGHRYPGKLTSPWYEAQIADLTDSQVARQLDIDYVGSLEARVYAEWSPERHISDRRLFDPHLPVCMGWDFGITHPTSVTICQNAPDSLRVVGEFETSDATPDQVVDGVTAILAGLPVAHPLTREWLRQILCVGDIAGKARSANTGTSLWDDYATHGFVMTGKWSLIDPTIVAVKRLLRGVPKPLLVDGAACPKFCEHAANNTYPTDTEGKRRPGASEPLDDEHNHQMRGFAYLVTHLFPPPGDDQAMPPPPAQDWQGASRGIRPGMAL
jgi:hypothetical protein